MYSLSIRNLTLAAVFAFVWKYGVAFCPHFRGKTAQASKESPQIANSAFAYPICAKTNGKIVDYSVANICVAYDGIYSDFKRLVDTVVLSAFDRADVFGGALRLAFHDAVDVDLSKPISDVGGSDGCISDAAGSAGLMEGYPNSPTPAAPKQSAIYKYLEPIYQKYCDNLNRADFFVLFAKFAVEYSEPTKSIKIPFQYGRRESQSCAGPGNSYVGRDPSGQAGVDEMVETFINNMGLTNVDIVTLLGGHTLGHVHKEFSGYDGHPNDPTVNNDITVNAWDSTPDVFDNDYFVKVRLRPWALVYGNPRGYVNAYANSMDKSKIPAVNSIWIDEACKTTAIGDGHVFFPDINQCSGDNRGPGTKLIALNADMALGFPINVTNYFNPGGNLLGQTLAHCELEEHNGIRDAPVRCYGPAMKPVDASTPFPPKAAMPKLTSFEAINVFFDDYYFRECPSLTTCCPNNQPCNAMVGTFIKAWDDPTGQIGYTKKNFLPTFNSFSAGSYQDRTQVGINAHNAFIQQFQTSFWKMVTAGYSVDFVTQKNQYSAAVNSKLGNLVSFDRDTSPCIQSASISKPPSTTPKSTKPTITSTVVSCTNVKLSQCGGANFVGQTCCPAGTCCTYSNLYWSDCQPSNKCAGTPSVSSTIQPTFLLTSSPSFLPTTKSTMKPATKKPLYAPSCNPSLLPSSEPTFLLSSSPSVIPTNNPTFKPTTKNPSYTPSCKPSLLPTGPPTCLFSSSPSTSPTEELTTNIPTNTPSYEATLLPTNTPTFLISSSPSTSPTIERITTTLPSCETTLMPTNPPTFRLSSSPSISPTTKTTGNPNSNKPSLRSTIKPTRSPTNTISFKPSTNKPATKQPVTNQPMSNQTVV